MTARPPTDVRLLVSLIFGCIALISFFFALRDRIRARGGASVPVRVRFRLAVIFAAMAAGLYLLRTYFP